MSITDELRKVAAKTECANGRCEKLYRGDLERIADRIDAEHKKACDDAWDNGYEADYLGIEQWLTEHPKVMGHHGWVELPKDADGEYIHVGDVLTDDAEFKSEGKVMRLMLEDEGWMVGFGCGGWTEPSIHEWHHHHAPTVEDVLRGFTDAILEWAGKSGTVAEVGTWSDVAAEYAAKLRLAEGEDA